MAKRLTDNINSQYFEAINKMTPKKARRRIVVYVESYDDVFFWRSVLGRYEDDKLAFDIMLLRATCILTGARRLPSPICSRAWAET